MSTMSSIGEELSCNERIMRVCNCRISVLANFNNVCHLYVFEKRRHNNLLQHQWPSLFISLPQSGLEVPYKWEDHLLIKTTQILRQIGVITLQKTLHLFIKTINRAA